jgi:TetR/AcrR family transcriptional regulator, regulator of cefoperazone and chloramphenicol sensitivity
MSGTRRRIIEAAGEIFAETGYQHATVREICRRAGVNIAAVNYHFGDKEGLYLSTLGFFRRIAFEKYPASPAGSSGSDPREGLRQFIRSFLFRILEEGPVSWFGRLVAREYVEPTVALDVLVEEVIRPMYKQVSALVEGLLGPGRDPDVVRLCSASIISQCLFYLYARPVLSRLFHIKRFSPEEIEKMADHVYRFSLGSLKEFERQEKGGPR